MVDMIHDSLNLFLHYANLPVFQYVVGALTVLLVTMLFNFIIKEV